jgi:hypothetical protein
MHFEPMLPGTSPGALNIAVPPSSSAITTLPAVQLFTPLSVVSLNVACDACQTRPPATTMPQTPAAMIAAALPPKAASIR